MSGMPPGTQALVYTAHFLVVSFYLVNSVNSYVYLNDPRLFPGYSGGETDHLQVISMLGGRQLGCGVTRQAGVPREKWGNLDPRPSSASLSRTRCADGGAPSSEQMSQ